MRLKIRNLNSIKEAFFNVASIVVNGSLNILYLTEFQVILFKLIDRIQGTWEHNILLFAVFKPAPHIISISEIIFAFRFNNVIASDTL